MHGTNSGGLRAARRTGAGRDPGAGDRGGRHGAGNRNRPARARFAKLVCRLDFASTVRRPCCEVISPTAELFWGITGLTSNEQIATIRRGTQVPNGTRGEGRSGRGAQSARCNAIVSGGFCEKRLLPLLEEEAAVQPAFYPHAANLSSTPHGAVNWAVFRRFLVYFNRRVLKRAFPYAYMEWIDPLAAPPGTGAAHSHREGTHLLTADLNGPFRIARLLIWEY